MTDLNIVFGIISIVSIVTALLYTNYVNRNKKNEIGISQDEKNNLEKKISAKDLHLENLNNKITELETEIVEKDGELKAKDVSYHELDDENIVLNEEVKHYQANQVNYDAMHRYIEQLEKTIESMLIKGK